MYLIINLVTFCFKFWTHIFRTLHPANGQHKPRDLEGKKLVYEHTFA